MPLPHPLNQAVIAQALHDLRNGQLWRCRAMGFSARALEALKHPEAVSLLLNARVPWVDVSIKCEIVHRVLDQERKFEQEIGAIDRMLRLGASTEMLSEFHGLTHQEVAVRREALGLSQRKGRWPVLSETQDVALWEHWHSRIRLNAVNLHDDAALLAVSMDLAEEQSIPLAVVWSAVRGWIDQGMT